MGAINTPVKPYEVSKIEIPPIQLYVAESFEKGTKEIELDNWVVEFDYFHQSHQEMKEGGEPSEYWTEWVMDAFEVVDVKVWLEGDELTLTNKEYEILSKKIHESII